MHFIHPRSVASVSSAVDHGRDDDERILRERRPNGLNNEELLQLLEDTREARRSWINESSPSITDIRIRYPRLFDVSGAVSFQFVAVITCFQVHAR